jgi:flagellar hook-associated protein 3 FlgL
MTILPITSNRVSLLQRSVQSSTTIDSTEAQISTLGQELATGRAVTVPSDDPSAAVVIQSLTQQLSDASTYSSNITAAQDQLNDADSTLGSLSTLLTQATSTAATNLNSTTTAADRAGAADTIDSIYSQVLSTANSTYEGRYLFGGNTAASAPYVSTANGVQYNASGGTLSSQTDTFATLDYQVSGQDVFGGLSASVSTGTDLSPAVEPTDLLSNLSGARNNGVNLGTINIGNGTTTTAVDLTGADTLQDVANDINGATIAGVTASVTATGLKLTASAGANITVADPSGGTAAADLGILHTTASGSNVAVTGSNVNAKVTQTTKLSDLLGGTGLSTAGFNIGNGSVTKTISLNGLTTVQDLVNAVNTAGIGVRATIRSDGSGIDLSNATQGADMTVTENGGQTATELGFTTFKGSTLLSSLNKGQGVATPTGTQFTITTADGSTINVGLTGITATSTVQDAITQINTAAGGKVTASVAANGSGIQLVDNTTGAGTLAVADTDSASTADDLGLTGGTVSGHTLTGTNVNPVQTPGLLTDLNDLRLALRANDTDAISLASQHLQTDSGSVTNAQAVVGSRVQELNSRSTTLASENTSTQSLLGTYQDVDYATAVTQYQTLQTSLQATLEVTASTMSLSLMDYLT